ncbi:hypothetical protein LIER_18737 [Lithospermum erythrorhizon]|uniref:Uncharacterized protein n=1 Tax=Lithospermum erythrorhizon TaxID=34254 RepID=A0AAV3QFA2_LITER
MLILLLKLIAFSLTSFSNLVSSLVFTATSQFLVLIIQGFRVPGQAFQGILLQLGEIIRNCLQYLLELIVDAASGVISSLFDHFVEGVSESTTSFASSIMELVEKSRTSFEGWFDDIPEYAQVIIDMIYNMLQSLWENYKGALGYIFENAF